MMSLLLFFALQKVALAGLVYTIFDQNNCTQHAAQGIGAICECSPTGGSCIDGTLVSQPGQCRNYGDLCTDTTPTAQCPSTQVMRFSGEERFDSDGVCGFGFDGITPCSWQRTKYQWSCCSCPDGFVNAYPSCFEVTDPVACVKCDQPGEVLTSDFQCVQHLGISCDIVCATPSDMFLS
jgi:hypothetical protein